jgi:hypothetical protein
MKNEELIGKRVQWQEVISRVKGTFKTCRGKVAEVRGQEIKIDKVWRWLPRLENLAVVEKKKRGRPCS